MTLLVAVAKSQQKFCVGNEVAFDFLVTRPLEWKAVVNEAHSSIASLGRSTYGSRACQMDHSPKHQDACQGKGEMQPYWAADLKTGMTTLEKPKKAEEDSIGIEAMDKTEHLVEWNVEVLASVLEQIVGSRGGVANQIQTLSHAEKNIGTGGRTVLEEFTPVIKLKRFGTGELECRQKMSTVDVGEEAKSQLRDKHSGRQSGSCGIGKAFLRDYLRPLDPVQFTVVFSALIHDVDHPGVPNAQPVKEKTRCAQIYKKSVAEQNSVDIAWDMLLSDEYAALRACICETEDELRRFRQLVVNTVLATDIVDKELQALRKTRWATAFSNVDSTTEQMNDSSVESEDQSQGHNCD
eukprot:scaffold543_cov119-Cylindrotheca_fusiformis.AAC.7